MRPGREHRFSFRLYFLMLAVFIVLFGIEFAIDLTHQASRTGRLGKVASPIRSRFPRISRTANRSSARRMTGKSACPSLGPLISEIKH